ncbi:fungal chitosanase of glycosyl hydrolase group 75-domain-containing protein [Aspergillus multicolor]|uniref:glycoside hydrolase family 75 protein n=1 Tax=Aspergillus multicolor TaxID=41759 RepID=UPI003CCDB1B2
MHPSSHFRHLAALLFASSALAQNGGPNSNRPNGDPPASYFRAAPTMPVAALQSAASQLGRTTHGGSFRISSDSSQRAPIYSDWALFNDGAAVVWTADMDVDCDGIDYRCRGNSDGLPETSWGELAAYEVPFIVIPEQYQEAHERTIPGNNIAAVICNGKMFYGILGDTNGDSPEVTGEASWLMARTCFPNEGINGANGHSDQDVTYILFIGPNAVLPNTAMNDNYITDFGVLRAMGDELVNSLVRNIGLGGGDSRGTVTHPRTRTRPPPMKVLGPVATARNDPVPRTLPEWVTSHKQVDPSTVPYAVSPSSAALSIAASSTPASSSAAPSSATPASSSGVASSNIATPGSSSSEVIPSSSASSVGGATGAAPIGVVPSSALVGSSSSVWSSATVGTPLYVLPSSSASPSLAIPSVPSPPGVSTPGAAATSAAVAPPVVNPPNAAAPASAAASPIAAAPPSAAATSGAASPGGPPSPASGATCSWLGHCLGDPCATLDDCADELVCASGRCAVDGELDTSTPGAPTPTGSISILAKRQESFASTSSATPSPTPTSTTACSWAGHCLGAPCSDENDCSDDLICTDGKCAVDNELESTGAASSTSTALFRRQASSSSSSASTPTPSCSWAGHCLGSACSDENDCSGDLICTDEKCAVDNELESSSTATPSATRIAAVGVKVKRQTSSSKASSAPTPTPSCSSAAHCLGAPCSDENDCSDDLICNSGACAFAQDLDDDEEDDQPTGTPSSSSFTLAKRQTSSSATPTPSCSWLGHCLGSSCSNDDDCSDDLACVSGSCAVDQDNNTYRADADASDDSDDADDSGNAGDEANDAADGTDPSSSATPSMSILPKRIVLPSPSPTPRCSWAGHCLGSPCATMDDCADDLTCVSGTCAVDRELDGQSITVTSTSRS